MHGKMGELQIKTAQALCQFLGRILPTLGSENWWQKYVIAELSHQQQQFVQHKNITELQGLDLAALLRVLDKNWYEISWKVTFPPDAKHYLKEMQTVRNHWAHASVEEQSSDDTYRDLDTLQRFCTVIGASDDLIDLIQEEKQQVIGVAPKSPEPVEPELVKPEPEEDGSLKVGLLVYLVSEPKNSGVITEIHNAKPENRYSVFINGEIKSYYESQLGVVEKKKSDLEHLSLNQFHAHLSALQIRQPSLSTLYSLNAARVDFIPYQFRPVLKFIRADRPRLLIADGVGVGKTIEAGLILQELQARTDIKSVLIVCPRPLVTERKWEQEMKRFDERFTQLDGKTLRHCISETDLEGEWPAQHAKTIMPYSLFDEVLLYGTKGSKKNRKKSQKGLLDLDPAPKFDLVIVDEAHHIRNPNTYSHEAVRFFCDNAEAVVFLTATPIQLGSNDLFVLLNTLRPDLILDRESFEHMAAPNPYINKAVDLARSGIAGWQNEALVELNEAATTSWGTNILQNDPEFKNICVALNAEQITTDDRVSLINELESLHTFSGIINRTRRRDIGEFTVRDPKTITIEFTPEQKELHDSLLEAQATILSHLQPSTSLNFMMTTIRRQAASCLFGLAPMLHDILTRRLDELFVIDAEEELGAFEELANEQAKIIDEKINNVIQLAQNLNPDDPKLESVKQIIEEKQSLDNNKLMLFSSFRHTLAYLSDNLSKSGVRVGVVHGGVPDEERVELRNQFRKHRDEEDALDVLLFSEVGCEGLDYQFCDCMINYDLPWNPMRIEQRIGRIDRRGQKSEKILIYNLITPGTVDADIYERCLMRIGIFNSAIGASEEILGTIAQEINDIAKDISLTETERQEKLQQIADNEIREIQEQQELEDRQAELFGIRLPAQDIQKDIEHASSFWLSPTSLQNMVISYLKKVIGADQEYIRGEKNIKSLRVSQEGRAKLLHIHQSKERKASTTYKQWENWLKGSAPNLQITFDSETASNEPDIAFITPLHPLAKEAASELVLDGKPVTSLSVYDDAIPSGQYPFAIYEWQYSGVRDNVVLKPLSVSSDVSTKIIELLEYGRKLNIRETGDLSEADINTLEEEHYKKWLEARTSHQEHTKNVAKYRRESLTTSHKARMATLVDRLDQATDDNIRRMRKSQIANAEIDYQRRIKELDEALDKADIHAQPVAYGVLVIEKGAGNE